MSVFLFILLSLFSLLLLFLAIGQFYLSGPDCSQYDRKDIPFFYDKGEVSVGREKLAAYLAEHMTPPYKGSALSNHKNLAYLREGYAYQGRTRQFESGFRPDIVDMDGRQVSGEWTIPPGADPKKRILFLHGGAFLLGSSVSHRPLTDNIARRTGCAVFAPDYRLAPEYKRREGIEDCKAAYKWILENGPDGPSTISYLGVSGDSAGGNLSLMLLQWARDMKLRPADAAAVLSPLTDSGGGSPSMRRNIDTDLVLGESLRPLVTLPKPLRGWVVMLVMGKINPALPEASPLFGDCRDLPPTLIQVSNTEMLFDDSCRFAEKARRAGSPVTLQVWRGQEHVWQHYERLSRKRYRLWMK